MNIQIPATTTQLGEFKVRLVHTWEDYRYFEMVCPECGKIIEFTNSLSPSKECCGCGKRVFPELHKLRHVGKTYMRGTISEKLKGGYKVVCPNGEEKKLSLYAIQNTKCVCDKCAPNKGASAEERGRLWWELMRKPDMVAEQWHLYESFKNSLPVGYTKGLTLVRKDKTLPFSKDNCEWYRNQVSFDTDSEVRLQAKLWKNVRLHSIDNGKVLTECLDCGHKSFKRKHNFVQGMIASQGSYTCPNCGKMRTASKLAKKEARKLAMEGAKKPSIFCAICGGETPRGTKTKEGILCKECKKSRVALTYKEYMRRNSGGKVTLFVEFTTSKKKSKWYCSEHDYVFEKNAKDVRDGGGCPKCSDFGIDMSAPCLLYYIRILHEGRSFYKIGISTQKLNKRFSGLMRRIKPLRVVEYATAREAKEEEQRILRLYSGDRCDSRETVLAGEGRTECFYYDVLGLDKC